MVLTLKVWIESYPTTYQRLKQKVNNQVFGSVAFLAQVNLTLRKCFGHYGQTKRLMTALMLVPSRIYLKILQLYLTNLLLNRYLMVACMLHLEHLVLALETKFV